MYTLAQYVFGIGKSDNLTDKNCASNDTAFFENEDPNQCVQTNIENDWILIEIEQKEAPKLAKSDDKKVVIRGPRKTRVKAKFIQSMNLCDESWFVEPPECFKNFSPDSREVKSSPIEDLLIEHPSMSVFDNLFTKRVVNLNLEAFKKPGAKVVQVSKKGDNGKENAVAVRSNKKKPVEVASVNPLTITNQNKALTAAIQSGETFHKKKCITKKNYERQNKVAIQRNGPIIRHKKMFTHMNGVYHNRNHC